MGGIHRLALAVGLIGGGVADRWGFRPAFVLAGVVMAAGMAFWVLPGGKADTGRSTRCPLRLAALRRHRRRIVRAVSARCSFRPVRVAM